MLNYHVVMLTVMWLFHLPYNYVQLSVLNPPVLWPAYSKQTYSIVTLVWHNCTSGRVQHQTIIIWLLLYITIIMITLQRKSNQIMGLGACVAGPRTFHRAQLSPQTQEWNIHNPIIWAVGPSNLISDLSAATDVARLLVTPAHTQPIREAGN